MNKLHIAGYDVRIIFQGFPGKSASHGNLGWSTVVLLRGHGRTILLDAGSMGMRKMLMNRLAEHGIKPSDVTDLLLTHSHHDHSINWTLFSHARIHLGNLELSWSLQQPWGETPVPELHVKELAKWPTLHTVQDGEEVLPNITAHLAPGHTPGSLLYVLHGAEHDVIFTGDAAKNRAELLSATTDMTYDPAVSAATIHFIWELWTRHPETVVVPGHDIPMTQHDGRVQYLTHRQAVIRSWFDNDMETTKTFQLT